MNIVARPFGYDEDCPINSGYDLGWFVWNTTPEKLKAFVLEKTGHEVEVSS